MSGSSAGHRRTLVGRVVWDKMVKTVTVEVQRLVVHPKFRKYVLRSKTYKAHDESDACRMSEEVVIRESRPLAKTKRWVVVERRESHR